MVKDWFDDQQDKFVCHGCGVCCMMGGDMGFTLAEVERINAHYLAPNNIKMCTVFTNQADKDGFYYNLHQVPCQFLNKMNKKCMIHEHKPQQCRDYPFKLLGQKKCILYGFSLCRSATAQLVDVVRSLCSDSSESDRKEVCGAFQSDCDCDKKSKVVKTLSCGCPDNEGL